MQSLQVRTNETNQQRTEIAVDPLSLLSADLDRLHEEIRALYKAALPPAVIHKIARGAYEQVEIGGMMLDDCRLRSANGTLNGNHLANARRWLAGVRRYIQSRQTAYGTSTRRKLYLLRAGRAGQ